MPCDQSWKLTRLELSRGVVDLAWITQQEIHDGTSNRAFATAGFKAATAIGCRIRHVGVDGSEQGGRAADKTFESWSDKQSPVPTRSEVGEGRHEDESDFAEWSVHSFWQRDEGSARGPAGSGLYEDRDQHTH